MRYSGFAFILACALGGATGGGAFGQAGGEETFSGEVTGPAAPAEFTLSFEAGDVITLTTESADNFDTVLSLTGPDGRRLAENDDAYSGTLQSQIIIQAPVSGDYVASVLGYGGAAGQFELIVREGVDFGLSEAATIVEERIVSLDASNRTVRFEIDLEAEDILVATTFALTPDLDTTLVLNGPDGATVRQNDDRGDGSLNSQILFQAETAGRYSVGVGSYSGEDVGDLVFSLAMDPEAELPFDFTSIEGELMAVHTGSLGRDPESVTFPVRLEAGQTVFAMADTVSGDLDPVLRMEGPDGFPVALNDDRGDGSLNSAFAFTASESGEYTLELRRYHSSDTAGEFELRLLSVDASVVDTLQALAENRIELSGETRTVRTNDFVVHYTLEGDDASSEEYAQSVGVALQEVYDLQINRDGWAEPIRDSDGLFRAFIADADGNMGVTYPVETVFDNANTPDVRETTSTRTVFLIENDFRGLGKAAPLHALMRATATHEFNHVVQYGYDAEEELDWLYEATASWVETTTVGADQDATDYVETDYRDPQYCWTTSNDGFDYSQWTLLESIANVHGDAMIVRVWEHAVELDGFDTMAAALQEVETTIPDVIERWRAQNFARDYELAPHFNVTVRPEQTLDGDSAYRSKGGLEQLGANYFPLELGEGRFTVSLDGGPQLALFALGVRDGEVHVVPLGASGVVDGAGWEYLGLMVFNREIPPAPGECSDTGYALSFAPAVEPMREAAYRFDARHFEALQD